jgi:hypothetical protein
MKHQMEEEERLKQKADTKNQMWEDIAKQLVDKDEKRRLEYEEFLKEKRMIDQIVATIHEEDQR